MRKFIIFVFIVGIQSVYSHSISFQNDTTQKQTDKDTKKKHLILDIKQFPIKIPLYFIVINHRLICTNLEIMLKI